MDEDTILSLDGFRLCHPFENKSGSILREQRVTQNMTQSQVATKANISLLQYQKFEGDERNISTASFQLACRVLEALNMDIVGFYHGEYVIGEEVYSAGDGVLRYKKTGRSINDDAID